MLETFSLALRLILGNAEDPHCSTEACATLASLVLQSAGMRQARPDSITVGVSWGDVLRTASCAKTPWREREENTQETVQEPYFVDIFNCAAVVL